jgi:hypothetical protein
MLFQLALTALVSFTSAPLRIVTWLGLLVMGLGAVLSVDAVVSWVHGRAVSGFATIIMTLLFIGSAIMISLGIIGEYIAKIYDEIKSRPVYLVESRCGVINLAMLEHPELVDDEVVDEYEAANDALGNQITNAG